MKAKLKHPHAEAPWIVQESQSPPIGEWVELDFGQWTTEGKLIMRSGRPYYTVEDGCLWPAARVIFWRHKQKPLGNFSLRRKT